MRPLKASDPVSSGPYRLLAELGSGGMGRVLLGAAPDGRLVAVKQVHAGLAADDGFRARFRREVAASQKVSGAYTAAVMDSDADAPTPWLASVFVAGPSLGAAVAETGTLSEDLVRRLAAGLASALAEVHRAGLIHRDLKPDNVLLSEDGVRVIDFGIARAAEAGAEHRGDLGLTRTGLVIGSPPFMSPEQAEGKRLTAASDVFSLGSVLVMAAAGRSPFVGSSTLQTLYDVVHAEPDLSGVPAGLRGIVERCLAKDPEARPTPAGLLGLLGPVAPVGRQWPPAVYRMIASQRAAIDRLLDGPGDTVVGAPGRVEEVGRAGSAEVPDRGEPAEPEGSAPPTGPSAPPRSVSAPTTGERQAALPTEAAVARVDPAPPRRAPRRALAVAVCVLAAAALGGAAYGLWPSGGTNTPETYRALQECDGLAVALPLPPRDPGSDRHSSAGGEARTGCTWFGSRDDGTPSARVLWNLRHSDDADAVAVQSEAFRALAADGRAVGDLGFGDEAFRGASDTTTACSLSVRDGNLTVQVDLGSEVFPAPTCDASTVDIARAALNAVPH
ncbi:serine/threonine-protein kinase [Streptomyces sp. WAC01280]|uniref:serine/threonine-protein kinase n=1 Tax=Streptomyces sp. WAC01280 TaxID=2487424 RepID=UPI000F79DAEE|nr:serine/threonine-protein kinase [Streptomyces sp. WAC01280]RSS58716.1 serine/threonine protein kinase [Streptomyces sp. WAC01280]